jgi:hypothetical protein
MPVWTCRTRSNHHPTVQPGRMASPPGKGDNEYRPPPNFDLNSESKSLSASSIFLNRDDCFFQLCILPGYTN